MRYLLFLILLVSIDSISETKEKRLRDVFIENGEFQLVMSEFEDEMHLLREKYIEAYKPSKILNKVPNNLLALEESLFLEISASNVYQLDREEIERKIIDDLSSYFSLEEVIELQEIMANPVFQKLYTANESVMHATKEYLDEWLVENQRIASAFEERREAISDSKIKHLKELAGERP